MSLPKVYIALDMEDLIKLEEDAKIRISSIGLGNSHDSYVKYSTVLEMVEWIKNNDVYTSDLEDQEKVI
jgi:hypothetical protein